MPFVRDLVVNGKTIAKAGAPAKGKLPMQVKWTGCFFYAPGQVTIRLPRFNCGW